MNFLKWSHTTKDLDDKSGYATWGDGRGRNVTVKFESFTDMTRIDELLISAKKDGYNLALDQMTARVKDLKNSPLCF